MFSTLVLADESYVQNVENEPRVMGITASVLAGEIIGVATSAIKIGLQSALKRTA